MRKTTLIYVFNTQGQMLLCTKKKSASGFSVAVGKRNGPGGKVDEGETIIQGAIRELEEEVGIVLNEQQLNLIGVLHFTFESKVERNQECSVFVSHGYEGDFVETDEMKPQRFDTDKLPYDQMRADDKYWMPFLLESKAFEFHIHANDDGSEHTYQQIKP